MTSRSIKEVLRDIRGARPTASDLIVDEMTKASNANEEERWNELLKQFKELESTKDIIDQREQLMDKWRLFVAAVLIAGLIVSVYSAMKQNVTNPQTTAQYLSLVSGLAGIAIGWLYGNNSAQRSNKRSRQRDNDSKQANQKGGRPVSF